MVRCLTSNVLHLLAALRACSVPSRSPLRCAHACVLESHLASAVGRWHERDSEDGDGDWEGIRWKDGNRWIAQ
jgi:hypothetical protein